MADPFARLNKSIFARLGEGAFLRGTENCSAEVSYGVAVNTESDYGVVTAYRTVANINYQGLNKPRVGDALTSGTQTFTLDSLVKEDGYSSQWVVLPAPAYIPPTPPGGAPQIATFDPLAYYILAKT